MLTPEAFLARWGGLCVGVPETWQAVALIGAATAFMETQTDRYFSTPRTVDEIVPGNGTRILLLREVPIEPESVGPVDVWQARCVGCEMEAVTDYVLRDRLLYRTASRAWWYGHEYRLRYDIGYELNQGPEDVREAVAQIAAWLWNEQGVAVDGNVRQEKIGDYSYQIGATGVGRMVEDLPMVALTIAKWTRINL